LAQTCVHKSPFQLHPSRHWLQSGWSCMLSSLRQWLQAFNHLLGITEFFACTAKI
jgi:hypothetical protein